MPGSQDFAADPRNEAALIYLNGDLVRREQAKVSASKGFDVIKSGIEEISKGKINIGWISGQEIKEIPLVGAVDAYLALKEEPGDDGLAF